MNLVQSERFVKILLRNWSYITEERDIADIRMQNKQMTICENISGSAGIAH